MKYSNDQIKDMAMKLREFLHLEELLNLLSEEQLNVTEIGQKLKVGTGPRDKAIIALEVTSFIRKDVRSGGAKYYSITNDGIKVLEIMEELNVQ